MGKRVLCIEVETSDDGRLCNRTDNVCRHVLRESGSCAVFRSPLVGMTTIPTSTTVTASGGDPYWSWFRCRACLAAERKECKP